jgi:hypothetical protein
VTNELSTMTPQRCVGSNTSATSTSRPPRRCRISRSP